MAAYLAPIGNGQQFFTNQGTVLSGGQLFTYQAGTTTLQATYTDSTQVTPNANPIILDSTGRSTNEIWLIGGSTYKFVLEDSNNNVIGTWDNLSGINDITGAVTQSEWITSSLTPTYVSATQFTLPGNQTSTFLVNRRLKIQVSAGLVYGYISASSFSSSTTTITVVLDSGNLDSGISQVSYSLLSPTNVSIPSVINWTSAVTISSASTVNIGAASSNVIIISGTTTITAFDTIAAGAMRWVKFSGALTLTYNATSMLLPGTSNIVTATNDEAVFISLGSGNWKCISYNKYDGTPITYSSPPVGSTRNAKMSITTASASATFTADEVICETTLGGISYRLANYSQTINLATTGAGGMDIGSAPVSGFVSLYAIVKADGTKNILACNVTTSTNSVYGGANMPSGYIASALIGMWPTNGSSQFVGGVILDALGRKFQYQTYVSIFTAGAAKTSLTSQSISTGVPAAAKYASIMLGTTTAGSTALSVAGDGTGIGGKALSAANSTAQNPAIGGVSATFGSLFHAVDIPLITAQTVFYVGTTSNLNMYVTDFSW